MLSAAWPCARRQAVGPDELDRGRAREHPVPRPPDLAHAAAAEALHELVAAHLARLLHGRPQAAQDEAREQGEDCGQVVLERVEDHGGGLGGRVPEAEADAVGQRPGGRRGQAGQDRLARRGRHHDREHHDQDAEPGDRLQRTLRGEGREVVADRDAQGDDGLVDEAEIEEADRRQEPAARRPGHDEGDCDDDDAHHGVRARPWQRAPAGQAEDRVDREGQGETGGDDEREQLQAAARFAQQVGRHAPSGEEGPRRGVARAARPDELGRAHRGTIRDRFSSHSGSRGARSAGARRHGIAGRAGRLSPSGHPAAPSPSSPPRRTPCARARARPAGRPA